DAVASALDLAGDAGLTISLDVNLRRKLWTERQARAALEPIAGRCDVVLGSLDELALLGGVALPANAASVEAVARAADAVLGLGPSVAVAKLGSRGAIEQRRGRDRQTSTA